MKDSGYRGIWTYRGSALSDDEYKFVHYSGGFATSLAKHIPLACYVPEVNKTFFCYGGTRKDRSVIRISASLYDHSTSTVPRPTIVMEKDTDDTHENPVLMLDGAGHLWVFTNAHGASRPAYIHRSREPYCIESYDLVQETNFSYAQPWYITDRGVLFLHTRYVEGNRYLFWMTSPNGREWSEPRPLSQIERGHYQISWRRGEKVGTAFNYHPMTRLTNDFRRTNLYYLETDDFGETWRNTQGETVEVPLTSAANPALAYEYGSKELRVYVKDLNFDAEGRPIIHYVTSRGAHSGPQNDPRTWMVAHWTGAEWDTHPVTVSDNNYDAGCLHVEPDGTWRIIGPTETGPQPYNTGGEVAVWTSLDQGRTWTKEHQVTRHSPYNHTYVRRPVNAHDDFYAFWADGHAREPSESRLYFCDKTGRKLFRLPTEMGTDQQKPEPMCDGLEGA